MSGVSTVYPGKGSNYSSRALLNGFTSGFLIYMFLLFLQQILLTNTICTNKYNMNNALFKEVKSGKKMFCFFINRKIL